MSAERDDIDDILALAQRGFEAEADVMTGDEDRIQRIQRAVERRSAARPRARTVRWVAGVAGGLLASGVALAAWRGVAGRDSVKRTPVASAAASHLPRPKDVQPAPNAQPPPSVTPQPPSRSEARARADAPSDSRVKTDANTTAAALFAAANSARVAGNATESMALAQRLLQRFPRSAEANSARLSLGMLRLQRGQAADALAAFQAYEDHATGGGLAEAWWGKAQALRQLGRTAEEKAALSELVRRFPRAAYVTAAQERLTALP